ncbi:hypothetical protein [Desulfonema magnum]|uniref:hypothetical protein n=1 Tax=Desulfonema magnum TaxID=45655 RepID=UPI001A9B1118|nr:hypothetical protein [Desulfonema magnum]
MITDLGEIAIFVANHAANMPPPRGLAGDLQTCCYKYAALTGLEFGDNHNEKIRFFNK